MSISFKLLVELNNEKYSVFVESDYKLITFKTVSNEIISQLNQNISLKTHSFEIYDQDFKEYVLITKESQLIENLSRIRVKTKDTNNLRKAFIDVKKKVKQMSVSETSSPVKTNNDLNSFCDYLFEANAQKVVDNSIRDNNVLSECKPIDSLAKSLDHFIENDLSKKSKDLAKYLFDSNKSVVNSVKEINVDKHKVVEEICDLNSESTDDTVVEVSDNQSIVSYANTSLQSQKDVINYLNIELMNNNYGVSTSCPHLKYQTFVRYFENQFLVTIRFKVSYFKGIQNLLDLMDINRRCFQKNPSNSDPMNPKWKTISDQMMNNGFSDWSPDKCRNCFTNALDLYKTTLEKCPDFSTADKVNPLFNEFHYFDLKFIISLYEFNVVRDLRFMFETKLNLNSNLKKYSSNQSLVSMNKSKDKNTIKSPTKQRDRIFRANNLNKFGSNQSLNLINNGFENTIISKNRAQIDKTKLKRNGEKLNEYLIGSFKTLAKSVETIVAQFGHIHQIKDFWRLISNQMKANGYKTYSPIECYQLFTEHVCDNYSLALTYCSDVKSAQEVYPLFEFIDSLDLRKCLSDNSYKRIRELRQQFNQKTKVL